MMKTLSKRIFIPLLEKRGGRSTLKRLTELEKSQWMSHEELKQLQEEKLRALIKHAYHNVPYYQRVFKEHGLEPEDIRTTEDLEKLPILTREDIRNNFADLIAQNYGKKEMKLFSTGGTTGEPLRYYQPKDSGWYLGAYWRGMRWYGVDMGDKYVSIAGQVFNPTMMVRLQNKVSGIIRGTKSLSSFELTPTKMQRLATYCRKSKPKYLRGYPSALYIFAKYIMGEGIQYIRPKAVITTAEKLYDYQREAIRQAFDCDVYEYYGCGEVLSAAYECPQHHGLHITLESVVIETVRNGKNVSLGEKDAILLTSLDNYAMPFIRYQNGDMGTISDEACPCGRGLPLLESVEGRTTDVIVHRSGFVSAPILTLIFKNLPVRQYQIIQESKQLIRIKIIKGEGYSQKDTDHVVGILRQYIGEGIEIRVEFVDSIPLTRSGKHRVVISKVPLSL